MERTGLSDEIISYGNGLTLYKENPRGLIFKKDLDRVPFAMISLKYHSGGNVVWTIKWDDGYNGCTIDHMIVYDSLKDAIDVVVTHWDSIRAKKMHGSNFIYEEIYKCNIDLQKPIAHYFGDSVYGIDKFNMDIYNCHIHNYPVKVLMQFGKKSRFLLSLMFVVNVDVSVARTYATIRPELFFYDGNLHTRWSVTASKDGGTYNSSFDNFSAAADYALRISGDLVLAMVDVYKKDKYLDEVLAMEVPLIA